MLIDLACKKPFVNASDMNTYHQSETPVWCTKHNSIIFGPVARAEFLNYILELVKLDLYYNVQFQLL